MKYRLLVMMSMFVSLVVGSTVGAQAIINGEPDGNRHPYVGLVTDAESFCSGSLISPTVFITAGHCADPGEQVFVTVESDASDVFDNPIGTPPPGDDYVTGTFYRHPQYCESCSSNAGLPGFIDYDLAVVILDDPIHLSSYAKLPSVGLVDRLAQKQRLTAVGYGLRDRSNREYEYGIRYFASVELIKTNDVISDRFIKLSTNPSGDKGGTCSGDSGGPILKGRTILAVNSFGNGNCASLSYAYRIDTVEALSFIRSIIRQYG